MHQSDSCRRSVSSFYSLFTGSLFVEAYWKRSQAGEAVWMLSKYHRIPIQSHLLHVVSDVVRVIALAEGFVRQSGDVVILHGEIKYRSFLNR